MKRHKPESDQPPLLTQPSLQPPQSLIGVAGRSAKPRSHHKYLRKPSRSVAPKKEPTTEEIARQEAIAADRAEESRRSEFRFKALCAAAPVSAITYSALTGHWASIIWFLILFTIGIEFATSWGGLLLASRCFIWPFIILAASTAILAWDFSATTNTQTWHERAGAVEADGWVSSATGRGATGHHGGVDDGLAVPQTRSLATDERWVPVLKQLWFLLPLFGASASLIAERIVLGKRKIYIPR